MSINRAELECRVFMEGRGINRFPVDLKKAAGKLKLDKPVKILFVFDLPDEIGAYTRKTEHSYYVFVIANHPHRRQRFSLAHEIGHLFMGHDIASLHAWNEHDTAQEEEANKFAAELLMPAYEMYVMANRYRCDIPQLLDKTQSYFDVSLSAAAQRITELDLFKGAFVLKDGRRICFAYSSPEFYEGVGYKTRLEKRLPSGKMLYILVAETYNQLVKVDQVADEPAVYRFK